jgi:DNA-binding transcriptional ArsR family regulator
MTSTKTPENAATLTPPSSLVERAPSLKQQADDAASLLSAMSNAKRLLILCNLVGGEMPVGQLAETVGLSQSALSQHLAKLRSRNLVRTRRDAQTIYYSIASQDVFDVLDTLAGIYVKSNTGMRAQPTEKHARAG